MDDAVEWMLADLADKYAPISISDRFMRLYMDDERFGKIFASLHEQLNQHFEAINGRVKTTHYYWADDSRKMLALISEMNEALDVLKGAGIDVSVSSDYSGALQRCKPWLSETWGSKIPDDFPPIKVIKYEPVFRAQETSVRLQERNTSVKLRQIGEGSYALVFAFTDPDYGIKFALKRAKKGLDERDLVRFKREFDVLKGMRFPYIVEVYQYNGMGNEYVMEFCDETLRDYIAKRNRHLSFAARKRIALQFLYGINYLHNRKHLHRDISLQNVLLKVFEGEAVLVKLSDFGLVKNRDSDFTRTRTELRGTIRDPQLANFKDYNVPNEIYSIGWILSYIFTGKEVLASGSDGVGSIVQKCTTPDLSQRYSDVLSLITDVERLEATPTDAPA